MLAETSELLFVSMSKCFPGLCMGWIYIYFFFCVCVCTFLEFIIFFRDEFERLLFIKNEDQTCLLLGLMLCLEIPVLCLICTKEPITAENANKMQMKVQLIV